ncbi:MAG: class I SAM-dependent methyltransferase [Burkholderiales bacterium]|nr:class I SAM-dependent methyltransferase [Burkholderiales bacterium]
MSSVQYDLIQKHLACVQCKGALIPTQGRYLCQPCDRAYDFADGVFFAWERKTAHYFDAAHQVMQTGNESPEISELCYAQQSRLAVEMIKPGDVVVDIGCGPSIHYEKPRDCVLIGIDPSFESIRSNLALDIRVFGGAEAAPFADRSVDRIFLFYSIHHMIGRTVAENTANLVASLRECGRMVRENGTLVVFDMSPWWPAWHAQRLAWNSVKGVLADKLDMYFWRESAVKNLAEKVVTAKAFSSHTFSVSPFLMFPPVFGLPHVRVPRFLYPFDIKMYKWSF